MNTATATGPAKARTRRWKRSGRPSGRVITRSIDADLSGYFDTIDHAGLLKLVARRVSDGSILKLVKQFLKAHCRASRAQAADHVEQDRDPQGGVISPLLANIYLNSLDHQANQPETGAKLVR